MTTRILIALVALTAAPALAQTPAAAPAGTTDPRWTPWIGCWHLLEDSVQDTEMTNEEGAVQKGGKDQRTVRGTQICVAPDAQTPGVTLSTVLGETRALVETIVADGKDRPIVEDKCRGAQRAQWSAVGQKLFSHAEITCDGQPTRVVDGLGMMVAGPTWIDIQLIESGGGKNIRVRRYQPADNRLASRSLYPIHTRWTPADIKEVSARLPVEVAQAALVETNAGMNLTSKTLLDLDEGGVPDDVIDLLVALSYPKQFVVERPSSSGGFSPGGLLGLYPSLYDSYYWSSYYSPYGYRYYGYYDPYYYQSYGFVPIEPGRRGGEQIEPSGTGRVVDGRGYTRVRERQPEPAIRVSDGNGGWTTASAGSNGNSGSSGGSSGVSSGGYSSGGGSAGGERVAVPRPPGGQN